MEGGEGPGEPRRGGDFFLKYPRTSVLFKRNTHTPCPATRLLHPVIHPESSVHRDCTCNRGSAKIGCTVLCGSPPYPFLASKPSRIRCSTRLACFFCQLAIRRVLLPHLVYPMVYIRGFRYRTCPMQACAQMRIRVHAITGHPAHTVQASVLTVLVFVVPQSATPSVQLLIVSGSSKGRLICHQCT